jgi:adhesin/invasin
VKKGCALAGLAAVLAVVFVAGAGSPAAAPLACPAANPPNELVLAGGSGQTAQLGKPFAAPLEVQLANTNGCPLTGNLAGYDVNFDAPGSGASGVFAATGSREAVVGTNGQGIATAPAFTANDTPGSYTVDAHSDFGSAELYLTNTASGLAASVTPAGGTPQEAAVNGAYAQPLRARVVDANGNPVQGVTVSFSIVPGTTGAGAAFLGGGQAAATTDSNGFATSPPLQANGSPGRFTAVASVDGIATVASYSLDNHAVTYALSAVGGPRQSATVGGRYPRPLRARLLDAAGQPVEGASITFTLGAAAASGGNGGGGGGGGAAGATFLGGAAEATVLTDANGVATTPPLLANDTPGAFTATATVAGSSTTLTYALQNLAARLVAPTPARSATVEHRYAALKVRVRSADGKPVAGASVTFTIGKATDNASAAFPDGTTQATVTTNSVGVATAPALTANSIAGSFKATATLPGSTPRTFTLRNRAGRPDSIATGAADGISTRVGSRLPIRLAVTVTDANGNPVAGALVRFAAPGHGAGGSFATGGTRLARTARVRTNADGIAIAPPFVANRIAGGYAVTARCNARRAAFALVNRP